MLNRIRIVLCRPEGGGNVGSVCRAMKNMGLSKLTLVSPSPEMDRLQLKTMAIHAEEIMERAPVYETLEEALKESVFTVGITRRLGNRRKFVSYLPEELAEKVSTIEKGEIAVIFGNEQNGLNDKELACCTAAAHIPSSPEHPSLNLAQAVQVMAYTFFRHEGSQEKQGYQPIEEREKQKLVDIIYESLSESGVIKKPDTFDNKRFFNDILGRATLSQKEAQHMEKLFQTLRYNKGLYLSNKESSSEIKEKEHLQN